MTGDLIINAAWHYSKTPGRKIGVSGWRQWLASVVGVSGWRQWLASVVGLSESERKILGGADKFLAA
jgi:hypothetical protein